MYVFVIKSIAQHSNPKALHGIINIHMQIYKSGGALWSWRRRDSGGPAGTQKRRNNRNYTRRVLQSFQELYIEKKWRDKVWGGRLFLSALHKEREFLDKFLKSERGQTPVGTRTQKIRLMVLHVFLLYLHIRALELLMFRGEIKPLRITILPSCARSLLLILWEQLYHKVYGCNFFCGFYFHK